LQPAEPAVAETIGFLDCRPDVVGAEPRDVVINLDEYRGRLRIVENGTVINEVLCAQAALEFLHMRLFEYSIADRPDATVVHAACLRLNGRRLLLAGSAGAGKSTLALRLLRAGFEIEGDEHVFVEDAEVIARPRACRVKEAALVHLSDMADAIKASPCYHVYGERIFNVDPRVLGCSWRIEQGRVDHIFVLRPNHGGYSSIRPIQPSALVQFLIPETGWRESDRGRSVAALALVASRVKAFELSLGDHATAVRCITIALNAC
jgi:serine kinase of HPr protein (carbohydrate metabolism regulator)